jgi:hypothetical protein
VTFPGQAFRAVMMDVRGPLDWVRVGSVSEIEPCGSLSSDDPAGRQVYVFGFRDDTPGVWRAVGGVDVYNSAVRQIATTGLECLSDLAEPYELEVVRAGHLVRLRFRVATDGAAL